jgi:hypothetical protein
LAKFFLGKQIKGLAACRPAPGSKSAEIARGHDLPPESGSHVNQALSDMLFVVPETRGLHPLSQSHDIDGNLNQTSALLNSLSF